MNNDPEKTQGLNASKWTVVRNDARSAAKHANCEFFVLDLNHDKFTKPALIAYADACRAEYPHLAADLDAKIARMP